VSEAALARPQIEVPPETLERVRLQVFSGVAKGLAIDHPKFEDFFRESFSIVEPNTIFQDAWYIGYVGEHLEAVNLGQIQRLAISIPPRMLKSDEVTVAFPPWMWIAKPWKRFMSVSYSKELAVDHSLARRRIIESDWYQNRWGSVYQIMPDQNQKHVFENTARGKMLATSAGGTATGKGANVIIFDDFINPSEAESEAERKQKISEYEHTFSSRLNDPKNDAMIVVAQRTHSKDLTGHVLAEGGWTHIELPIIAPSRKIYSFPISGREVVVEQGEILNPARNDQTTIAKQKRASGSRAFSAQWLCQPASDEGNMVKRYWWKFYREEPKQIMELSPFVATSWDFSFKDNQEGSFVVGMIGALVGTKKYLLGEVRDHLDFTASCKAVISTQAAWPKICCNLYEDRANGPAIKSALSGKVKGLVAVEPLGSKVARMSAATPDIEAGDVLLPYPYDDKGNPRPDRQWVLDYIEELAKFPEEPNDRGDATSQLIVKLNNVYLDQPDHDEMDDGLLAVRNGDGPFGEMDLGNIDIGGLSDDFLS